MDNTTIDGKGGRVGYSREYAVVWCRQVGASGRRLAWRSIFPSNCRIETIPRVPVVPPEQRRDIDVHTLLFVEALTDAKMFNGCCFV